MSADEPPKKGLDIDVNAQLAKLLENQKLQPAVNKEREYTEEERRIKQQILAQYSQVTIGKIQLIRSALPIEFGWYSVKALNLLAYIYNEDNQIFLYS